MRLKKEQKAREEFEKMKEAAASAWENKAQAKNFKQNQFQTSMVSLKGTIPVDKSQVNNSRFEESSLIDQSRESLEESLNNRTIQYTERSNTFQEDVKLA